jgi:hypothetical protein
MFLIILEKVFLKISEWELFKIISNRGFYKYNIILILFLSIVQCMAMKEEKRGSGFSLGKRMKSILQLYSDQ